jgi:7-cyano-7-deazaguanine synthase
MTTALLLSGGMDSISIAWWKRPEHAITIDYGQRAAQAEKKASAAVCAAIGIKHHVVTVDCRALGSGDMAGTMPDATAPASDWWPYRNQMLVTFAVMKGIALGVRTLYIGTVRSDEGHRDGTTEFVRLMNDLVQYQEGEMKVEAPAIGFSTPELVRHCEVPGHILAWAHSCHKADLPCNNCRGCNKYIESMAALSEAA